ncbi:DNA damage-binding protein 1a [Boothiomyces sp. JEL0838]|nr:DNA damage-binding protein 1a [Boothiomyces sp. JEL0838]
MFYIKQAHPPDAVSGSLACHFTHPDHLNLIVNKITRIEIYLFVDELKLVMNLPINGRLDNQPDTLVILTQKQQLSLLQWKDNTVVTVSSGSVKDRGQKLSENSFLLVSKSYIGIYIYQGIFKILPIRNNQVMDCVNKRLDKLDVIYMAVHNDDLYVLYQNIKEERYVVTYKIGDDIEEDLDFQVEDQANMLIPTDHGIVIVGKILLTEGQHSIQLNNQKTIFKPTVMKAYTIMNDKILLGDYQGNLHLLDLNLLKCNIILNTVGISTLSWIQDDYLYVGSSSSNSQLIQLFSEKQTVYQSLGPISDFVLTDLDEQSQLITCSGYLQSGSLRIIRNGIGIDELSSIDLQVLNLFSLGEKYLVTGFISETRILALDEDLSEFDQGDFDFDVPTIHCGNVGNYFIQITKRGIKITTDEFQLYDEYRSRDEITLASFSDTDIVIAQGSVLQHFTIKNGKLTEQNFIKLDTDVACIHVKANQIAVGIWDSSVRLHKLPSLIQTHSEQLENIPKSILLVTLENVDYLMVAEGTGVVYTFSMFDFAKKKISLGTRPITLHAIDDYVFCSSDRPTIIYSQHSKLVYSNVNLRHVKSVVKFDHWLAIATDDSLKIGTIDTVQKLHVKTVPIGETVRRIVVHEQSSSILIMTQIFRVGSEGESVFVGYLKLLDSNTFEVLDSYELNEHELGSALHSCTFDEEYVIFGTCIALPDEDEPAQGRLLVFRVTGDQLELVNSVDIEGACYSITSVKDRIAVAINTTVCLYEWHDGLVHIATHHGHILALTLSSFGDFIIVGDLVKSISCLVYDEIEKKLIERARDYDTNWMINVQAISEDLYIGSDDRFNIICVKKNNDIQDFKRLQVVARYHVGQQVNRFRLGSIVVNNPDQPFIANPILLYATINGALGVICTLSDHVELLTKLEASLKQLPTIGNLSHDRFREFENQKLCTKKEGFIDGDLVEAFVDLDNEMKEKVAQEVGQPVQELTKIVQDLARIH